MKIRVRDIGSQYEGLGSKVEYEGIKFSFLGIFSKNREEWAIVDLACARSDVTIVPFFESLGPDNIAYIINQTELKTICCESKQM